MNKATGELIQSVMLYRMANHTRVFHRKPTLEECIDAVRKQYYSGEGAIQWAGEAVARANLICYQHKH